MEAAILEYENKYGAKSEGTVEVETQEAATELQTPPPPKYRTQGTQTLAVVFKSCQTPGVRSTYSRGTQVGEGLVVTKEGLATSGTSTATQMEEAISSLPPEEPTFEDMETEEDDEAKDPTYKPYGRDSEDSEEENITPSPESSDNHDEGKCFLVFKSCLYVLLVRCLVCCAKPCKVFLRRCFGSLVVLSQHCPEGHNNTWESQPSMGSMPLGNLMLSSSIMFSGSSSQKVLNMFSFMKVPAISIRTYNNIQSSYLVPAIKNNWLKQQQALFKSIEGKVTVGGDGRCDSPGHCAKHGSYTLMDLSRMKVLDMQLVQVIYNSIATSHHLQTIYN